MSASRGRLSCLAQRGAGSRRVGSFARGDSLASRHPTVYQSLRRHVMAAATTPATSKIGAMRLNPHHPRSEAA